MVQLQKIRCLRHRDTGEWILVLDLFPNPRRSFWVLEENSWGWMSDVDLEAQGFATAQHPLALYLKSHFAGRRLGALSLEGADTIWDFGEGYQWRIQFEARARQLKWTIEVPSKKPFSKELTLLPSARFGTPSPLKAPLAAEDAPSATREERRTQRLLENIRRDMHGAREWLAHYLPLCTALESEPWLWQKSGHPWDAPLSELQASGLLPPVREARTLGVALDKLFNERARQERKTEKSSKRLRELELRVGQGERVSRIPAPAHGKPSGVRERSSLGVRVEVQPGIYGYLGRNAAENERLFKAMRDRDFWFHVRGYSGGHFWLPRAGLGIGREDPLPHPLVERAAKIALWNSKLKNSQSGPVDFTEKRHLKKLKGEAGMLKILRSEVLFVSLEDSFESTLKWG